MKIRTLVNVLLAAFVVLLVGLGVATTLALVDSNARVGGLVLGAAAILAALLGLIWLVADGTQRRLLHPLASLADETRLVGDDIRHLVAVSRRVAAGELGQTCSFSVKEIETRLPDEIGVLRTAHREMLRELQDGGEILADLAATIGEGKVRTRQLAEQLDQERQRASKLETDLAAAKEEVARRVADLKALDQKLLEQSVRDPLTGLYNRPYLEDTLGREISRARRERIPITLMLFDLDEFKAINDAHGHGVGDQVLRRMGEILQKRVRLADIPCRFGGAEFMVVLPRLPLEIGIRRADDLRKSLATSPLVQELPDLRQTASVGVATYPTHGEDASALIASVKAALAEAKQGGHNQLAVAERSEPAGPAASPSGSRGGKGDGRPGPASRKDGAPGEVGAGR